MTFVQRLTKKLEDFLKREDNILSVTLGKVESLTGVSRLHLATTMMIASGIYMIFGHFAQLICNMIGFFYSAYLSLVALDSPQSEQNHEKVQHLLRYWVIYAFWAVGDFYSLYLFRLFPFYWLLKTVFIIWCLIPGPNNGTTYVYFKSIQPIFRQVQPLIDGYLNLFLSKIHDKTNEEHQE